MSAIITKEIFQENRTTMADPSISLSCSMQSELCIYLIYGPFFFVMHTIVVTDSSQIRIHVSSLFWQWCPVVPSIEQWRSKTRRPLPHAGNNCCKHNLHVYIIKRCSNRNTYVRESSAKDRHPDTLHFRGFLWHQLLRDPWTKHPPAPAGHQMCTFARSKTTQQRTPKLSKNRDNSDTHFQRVFLIRTDTNAFALIKTWEFHLHVRAVLTTDWEHGSFFKDPPEFNHGDREQNLNLRSYQTIYRLLIIWAVCWKGRKRDSQRRGRINKTDKANAQ